MSFGRFGRSPKHSQLQYALRKQVTCIGPVSAVLQPLQATCGRQPLGSFAVSPKHEALSSKQAKSPPSQPIRPVQLPVDPRRSACSGSVHIDTHTPCECLFLMRMRALLKRRRLQRSVQPSVIKSDDRTNPQPRRARRAPAQLRRRLAQDFQPPSSQPSDPTPARCFTIVMRSLKP